MRKRVGIVDARPALVLGVTAILNAQQDLHVAAAAGTTRGLIRQRIRLDVILLDLLLPDGSTPTSSLEALAVFHAPVLAFTTGDQPDLLQEAAQAGAVGAICTSETPERIVDVVRRVARGEQVVTAGWAAAEERNGELASAGLSMREAEVLALYASGETAESVAAALFISRDTVNDHIRRIRGKYAAAARPSPTKVDLFRRAVEDGLVAPHR